MKINHKNQFYSIFDALLIIILLENKIVFSKDDLAGKKPCKAINENTCVIICRDWNLDSKTEAVGLRETLKAQKKKFKTCTLILENCFYTNRTTNPWREIDSKEIRIIEDLRIINSLIDLKELNLKFFKTLRRLTLKNTTMVSLQSEDLQELPELQKLHIKQNNFLEWVEKNFLQYLTLTSLQIQGVNLNQTATIEFFKNLTNGNDIPSVREVDWSHNNFGNFKKVLLTHFPNLNVLILNNSSISNFENGIFSNTSIGSVHINKNKIRKLPEKIFRPLIKSASFVSLEDNLILCDCEIEWLQILMKKHKCENVKIECAAPEGVDFLEADICPGKKSKSIKNPPFEHCTPKESSQTAEDHNSWANIMKFSSLNLTSRKFSILNDEPEVIVINLNDTINLQNAFLWYGNYANTTSPRFICRKILQQKFSITVTPDVNYLICLAKSSKYFKIDIFDCLPIKTKPLYENQPWLTKKSISLSITSVFGVFLLALTTGALIIYITVRKNPSLIRGSKRVIEVKRHDKAQILIMPRGYEVSEGNQSDGSSLALMGPQMPLEPSRSYDTISTVSYVSANQPTQLEILTYRLNRLRELFQRNNSIPSPVPSVPMQIATPINQRLPPNVDLLFEYEWYTITTKITTNE